VRSFVNTHPGLFDRMDENYMTKDCEAILESAKKEGADRMAHLFKGENQTCFPKINFANLTVRKPKHNSAKQTMA